MEPIDNGKTFVCNNKQSIGKIFNLHRFRVFLHALLIKYKQIPIHFTLLNQQQISALAESLFRHEHYLVLCLSPFFLEEISSVVCMHNISIQNLFNVFRFDFFSLFIRMLYGLTQSMCFLFIGCTGI